MNVSITYPQPERRASHLLIQGGALVAGTWRACGSGPMLSLDDPSTGAPRAILRCDDGPLVSAAVASAVSAFAEWRATDPAERAAHLRSLADQIDARSETFTRLIAEEVGAPVDYARTTHVKRAGSYLRDTAIAREMVSDDTMVADARVVYDPLGPIAAITPWNWPLNQLASKTALALAAGCTVVLKPSEQCPRTARLFAEAVQATDIPPGVVTMVLGDARTGQALVEHDGISGVSCTASTDVGRVVASCAARLSKPAVLELGGNCANIIFADRCSIPTLSAAAEACFRNTGQACNAATRILVERSAYSRTVDMLSALADTMEVKSAYLPGQHLGPVATQAQRDRLRALSSNAIAQGARQVAGHYRIPDCGWFVRPTVFANVRANHKLFQSEIFGPILTVTPFDTEAEAISLANHSAFGLAAYVQTDDLTRAERVARALSVGVVQINGAGRSPMAPFGGRKASGCGVEQGPLGLRALQVPKSLSGLVS